MEQFEYTFIIPHKNCPELLKRCVDSIPDRDDIQIVVVDDNSDEGKKPILNRDSVEIILLSPEQSKGAGRARNVGLEHAKGEWLLFADADDYYVDGFMDILDSQLNESLDVLYFNARTLGIDGKEKKGGSRINKITESYNGNQNTTDLVKYRIHVPWNKVIKQSYVDKFGFQFEEVPNGNDSMFTYQVGFFAKNIKVIQDKLYVYTMNSSSITHKKYSLEARLSVLCNIMKNKIFYEFVGHKEWGDETGLNKLLIVLIKHFRIIEALELIIVFWNNKRLFKKNENRYVELIEKIRKGNEYN